ncbi:NUDIX hydrolase [Bacillus sp. FJAT-45350]|uniref:NUDIX hydrolase n=1 Tax=Bacillus sp. FJAT-45350 TaxID=2011014 RepID=UPI000BB7865D|nr:NUDIX hydrolase [Bacillus sp. FJAT-45350]
MRYQFCPKCGGKLTINSEQDKNKPKCVDCGFVFYQNPIVGVAAIVIKNKQVLLGKRNISYKDKWCIPCGYVEYDEDVKEAVIREFNEETGIEINVQRVYEVHSNFHNPKQQTVGIWFLAEEIGGSLQANDDLSEVNYFSYSDLPELAFETDKLVLDKLKAEGYID